jgi:hypothetical protein
MKILSVFYLLLQQTNTDIPFDKSDKIIAIILDSSSKNYNGTFNKGI